MNLEKIVSRSCCLNLIVATICLHFSPVAHADDGDVLNFGASENVLYDDNIFRLPDGVAPANGDKRADWNSQTVLILNVNKPVGRQTFSANLNHGFVRYFQNDRLDYQSRDYRASWKGGFGSDSSFSTSIRRNALLSSFSDVNGGVKNVTTNDTWSGDLFLRVGGTFYGVSNMLLARTRNSSELQKGSDDNLTAADFGVRMDLRTGNWLETRLRRTRARYTLYSDSNPSSYTQNELVFSAHYQISGQSDFDGSASYLSRTHEHQSARDFSRPVAMMSYKWRPSDISTFTLGAYRRVGAVSDAVATYAVSDEFDFAYAWQYTAKLTTELDAQWLRRKYLGDLFFLPIPVLQRREIMSSFGLTNTYALSRLSQIQFVLRTDRRHGNYQALQYDSTSAMLNGQIMF